MIYEIELENGVQFSVDAETRSEAKEIAKRCFDKMNRMVIDDLP